MKEKSEKKQKQTNEQEVEEIKLELNDDTELPEIQVESIEEQQETNELTNLHQELENVKKELEEVKKELLRSIAENQTIIRRKNNEMQDVRRYASESIVKSLIPALLDFDRVIQHSESSQEQTLQDAVKMLHQKVERILSQEGIKKIQPTIGDKFDPNFHDAISQVPTNEVEDHSIFAIAENGWMLHDRLLQPAKVVVAIHQEDEPNNSLESEQ